MVTKKTVFNSSIGIGGSGSRARVELHNNLRAFNTSPPRNRSTFLLSSCSEIENCAAGGAVRGDEDSQNLDSQDLDSQGFKQ